MNNFRTLRTTTLAVASVSSFLMFPSAFGQGALAPPGSPAPTMKTLSQIEPRFPISSAPFSITNPGAYYLTTNVTVSGGDAIVIAASGVTLDLQGFTVSSTAPSANGTGILLTNSVGDVIIYNGHIRGGVTNSGGIFNGSGFASGVAYSDNSPTNSRVSGISASGCLTYGIFLGTANSTVAESCTVLTAGFIGIGASTVKGCVASGSGGFGISADQVSDCSGDSSGFNGSGISATVAQNCIGSASGSFGAGISAFTAQNCSGSSSGLAGFGISAESAENCRGNSSGSSGTAIDATTTENCSASANSGDAIITATARNCQAVCVGGAAISANMGGILMGCTVQGSPGINASDGSTIKDCTAVQCAGDGISTGAACTVEGCIVIGSGAHGITVGTNSSVTGCTVKDSAADGVLVANYCRVIGNTCLNNGAPGDATKAGIHIAGSNCRVEDNHAVANKFRGILIDAAGHRNVVVKNTAKDNVGLDFDLMGAGDNNYGQIVATPGANFVNSNPWANFAF